MKIKDLKILHIYRSAFQVALPIFGLTKRFLVEPITFRPSPLALRSALLLAVVLFAWVGTRWLTTTAAHSKALPLAANGPVTGKAPESFTVGAADILGTILITGELRAANSLQIIAPRISSGFAQSVTFLAPEGASVKRGQRILEFDASSLLSQKSEAQRKLDESKLKILKTRADLEAQHCDLLNELAKAEGDFKVAQLYAKIEKDLLEANKYEKYQLDLERAKLALDKAKEKLANLESSRPAQMALVELEKAQAEVDLKKIDADLARLQVDAPQDGIIIYGDNWANNRKVQVGDNVFPGMPVLSLPDLSSMEVVGYVYDTELRFLSPGMVCDLRLDAVPGKVWRGKIVSLTSVASRKGFASQHKVFKATIQPDSTDPNVMKPGMAVRVDVPVSLASHVVAIPREYVRRDAHGRYCVRKGNDPQTAVLQVVKVGVFNERWVQISEGLSVGDRILLPRAAAEAKS